MLRTLTTVSLVLLSILAAGLRLTVRDAVPGLAPIYYAFPPVVIAATVVLAAVLMRGRVRPAAVRVVLVGGLSIAAAAFSADFKGGSCAPQAGNLRVLTWNLSHGYGGWDALAERARAVDAHLLLLVEAGGDDRRFAELWRRYFPDYEVAMAGGGITLIARGRLSEVRFHELVGRSRAVTARLDTGAGALDIVAVDLDSNPFFARGRIFAALAPLLAGRSGVPVVVAGDFNTPFDSTWLATLKSRFNHGFTRAGRGWAATWPVPAPILAIDHLWVSPEVEVVCERHSWTSRSDHVQLIADLALAPRAVGQSGVR